MVTYWYVLNDILYHGSGDKSDVSMGELVANSLPMRTIIKSNFILAFDHETNMLTLLKNRLGNGKLDNLLTSFVNGIIDSDNMDIRVPTCLLDGYTLSPHVERKFLISKLSSRTDVVHFSSMPCIDINYNSIHVGWFCVLLYLIATDTEITMDSFITVSLQELEMICEMNYETSRNFSMIESIWYMARTLYESP